MTATNPTATGRRTGLTLELIVYTLWARKHTGLFVDSVGYRDLIADRDELCVPQVAKAS